MTTIGSPIRHRGFMRRLWVMCCVGVVACSALPASAATPADVQKAIDKAKQFLYSQHGGENWEEAAAADNSKGHASVVGRQWGGLTSIATYALLAGRESPQEPRLQKAIAFLRKANMQGIYALGMRASVWQLLPNSPENRAAIALDYQLLITGVMKSGPSQGLYTYWVGDINKRIDASVSQYGVLGMWALEQSGAEVPGTYWRAVDDAWRRTQNPDGGWAYDFSAADNADGSKSRHSMTAAGIASLFITQDYTLSDRGLECRGNVENINIKRGMDWMAQKYSAEALQKGQVGSRLYTLYGIERIGVASGFKYFGTTDWYDTGADWLVKNQRPDGSWEGHGSGRTNSITGAAWGILFLQRGRAPVVFNKLDYATGTETPQGKQPPAWNQRPRDAANLVKWIGKQTERDLNFQIVNLSVPQKDLHDAPIIYIAGSEALTFSEAHTAKLKAFVEDGGMLLFNADCANRAFIDSVRKLGKSMFPAYEFRPLPDDHSIYKNQLFPRVNWKAKPVVEGLSNDSRELILIVPQGDPARSWQVNASGSKSESFELGTNIFLYAVDKSELRFKGESYIIEPDPKIKTDTTLSVARLMVGPNPNPEPGGWRRMAAVLRNQRKIDLKVEPVKVGTGALDPKKYRVAHLTGTMQLKLGEMEKNEIKNFITGGGFLIVDAAGGNQPFSNDVQTLLEGMFPEEARALNSPLPVDHVIYTKADGALRPGDTTYRSFARRGLGADARTPRLRGMTVKDGTSERVAVFFSPEDLSTALVGMPVDGIYGYSPATATLLMQKMLIYAQANGKF